MSTHTLYNVVSLSTQSSYMWNKLSAQEEGMVMLILLPFTSLNLSKKQISILSASWLLILLSFSMLVCQRVTRELPGGSENLNHTEIKYSADLFTVKMMNLPRTLIPVEEDERKRQVQVGDQPGSKRPKYTRHTAFLISTRLDFFFNPTSFEFLHIMVTLSTI